jgi:hypothetical protein
VAGAAEAGSKATGIGKAEVEKARSKASNIKK